MLKKQIKNIFSAAVVLALISVSSTCYAATSTPQLIEKSIFKENEQSLTIIHPKFNDGATNIIFYALYCDEDCFYGYTAETIGHGDLPFSAYYAPAPGIGKYIAVEYSNENGNFGCTGISFNDCIVNSHFVSQFSFEVVDNNATITQALETKNSFLDNVVEFLFGTTSENSVTTSSTGILDNVLNGITGALSSITTTDDIANSALVETPASASEPEPTSETKSGLLDTVLDFFLHD